MTNLQKQSKNPPENHTKWSNSMDFGFEKIMDIDKLNMANLVGKLMGEIMECKIFLPKCTERYKSERFAEITKSKKHISRQTSLPYFGVKLSCVCLMFAYRKKSNDL